MEVSRARKRASRWRLGKTKMAAAKEKGVAQSDAFQGSYAS
jgi:hypothetical protein